MKLQHCQRFGAVRQKFQYKPECPEIGRMAAVRNVSKEIKRNIYPSFSSFCRYAVHFQTDEGGLMAAADPIRNPKQLQQLAEYWLKLGNYRNYVLIILGVHTALRIGDLLRVKWDDVYDGKRGKFRSHIILTEKKTGKQKTVALNQKAISALRLHLPHGRGEYIFAGNRKNKKPISRVQAWRIVRAAADVIKVAGRITCHSLRKTFGYFAWKMGVLPVMLMDIFNHSSFEITRRYLGISQDDRDKVYLDMALFSEMPR